MKTENNSNLEKKIDEISMQLERAKIADYVDIMKDKKKLLYLNFIGGVARGFGMAIGFTVLGALVIYLLQKMLTLPIIGDFISEIVKIVQEKL